MHPHRGIETVSYVARGKMLHRDSMGHEDEVSDGEIQWMCAGSGILHEEMPHASERLLGVQMWLNLPAAEKMCRPAYHAIEDVSEAELAGGVTARVVAGSLGGVRGFAGDHLPAEFYELQLPAGASIEIPVASGHAAHAFLLEGDTEVCGRRLPEKTAVAFADDGDTVTLAATADAPARTLFFSAPRLDEPVAWGGPVVMNTEAELHQAFLDMRRGTFVRERPEL